MPLMGNLANHLSKQMKKSIGILGGTSIVGSFIIYQKNRSKE
ncbi:TPA: hypothetical protein QFG33_002574 [Enterococcus faecium]